MNDPASISRTDTPLWDALQRAVIGAVPGRPPDPAVHASGSPTPACSASSGAIAYGAGLFSPSLDAGRVRHAASTATTSAIDVESLR